MLKLIQSYEDKLISNDKTVCFYEMMTETYNFLGERKGVNLSETTIKCTYKDEITSDIIKLVNKGYGVEKAMKELGFHIQTLSRVLSKEQKDKITKAKYEYTLNYGKTKDLSSSRKQRLIDKINNL